MRSLIVSTFDKKGGAAIAAHRIHSELRTQGIESEMLVQYKITDEPHIHALGGKLSLYAKFFIDRIPFYLHPHRVKTVYSSNIVSYSVAKKINALKPDIVQLCWVGGGFIPISEIKKIKAPIVWRLSDMWPFTGGCHYSESCQKFTASCGACPLLKSNNDKDISHKILRAKQEQLPKNITVVAISTWLAEQAKKSSLFKDARIEVIHNGVDTSVWRPLDKRLSRTQHNLPQDKKIILFGADNASGDTRKGFAYVHEALARVAEKNPDVHVVVFGNRKPIPKEHFQGLSHTQLGKVSPVEKLVSVYSAADVFVAPSTQEAFGQTALEAMACGTPPIVFENTGLADIPLHKKTGFIAKYRDAEDLAKGILWALEKNLSLACASRVQTHFTIESKAKEYLKLYRSIMG